MYQSGYTLRTSADFDYASHLKKTVTVWQFGRIIDHGGPLVSHSDESVKIGDVYFLKSKCEFKVR